jgi:hypothetical protein
LLVLKAAKCLKRQAFGFATIAEDLGTLQSFAKVKWFAFAAVKITFPPSAAFQMRKLNVPTAQTSTRRATDIK